MQPLRSIKKPELWFVYFPPMSSFWPSAVVSLYDATAHSNVSPKNTECICSLSALLFLIFNLSMNHGDFNFQISLKMPGMISVFTIHTVDYTNHFYFMYLLENLQRILFLWYEIYHQRLRCLSIHLSTGGSTW